MKITILICDGCNRRNDGDDKTPISEYRINHGKEMDASGNGYETNWEYVEWCRDCHALACMRLGKDKIQRVVTKPDFSV